MDTGSVNDRQTINTGSVPKFTGMYEKQPVNITDTFTPLEMPVFKPMGDENALLPKMLEEQRLQPQPQIPNALLRKIIKRETPRNIFSLMSSPVEITLGTGYSQIKQYISADIKSFLEKCASRSGKIKPSDTIQPAITMGDKMQIQALAGGLKNINLVNLDGSTVASADIEGCLVSQNLYFEKEGFPKTPVKSYEDLKLLYLLYCEKDKITEIQPSKGEKLTAELLRELDEKGAKFSTGTEKTMTIFEVFKKIGKEPVLVNEPSFKPEKIDEVNDITALAYLKGLGISMLHKKKIPHQVRDDNVAGSVIPHLMRDLTRGIEGADISGLGTVSQYVLKGLDILGKKNAKFCDGNKEPVSLYGVYKHFSELEKCGSSSLSIYRDNEDGTYSPLETPEDIGALGYSLVYPAKVDVAGKLGSIANKDVLSKVSGVIFKKSSGKNAIFTEKELITYWEELNKQFIYMPSSENIDNYQKQTADIFKIILENPRIFKKEFADIVIDGIKALIKKGHSPADISNNMSKPLKDETNYHKICNEIEVEILNEGKVVVIEALPKTNIARSEVEENIMHMDNILNSPKVSSLQKRLAQLGKKLGAGLDFWDSKELTKLFRDKINNPDIRTSFGDFYLKLIMKFNEYKRIDLYKEGLEYVINEREFTPNQKRLAEYGVRYAEQETDVSSSLKASITKTFLATILATPSDSFEKNLLNGISKAYYNSNYFSSYSWVVGKQMLKEGIEFVTTNEGFSKEQKVIAEFGKTIDIKDFSDDALEKFRYLIICQILKDPKGTNNEIIFNTITNILSYGNQLKVNVDLNKKGLEFIANERDFTPHQKMLAEFGLKYAEKETDAKRPLNITNTFLETTLASPSDSSKNDLLNGITKAYNKGMSWNVIVPMLKEGFEYVANNEGFTKEQKTLAEFGNSFENKEFNEADFGKFGYAVTRMILKEPKGTNNELLLNTIAYSMQDGNLSPNAGVFLLKSGLELISKSDEFTENRKKLAQYGLRFSAKELEPKMALFLADLFFSKTSIPSDEDSEKYLLKNIKDIFENKCETGLINSKKAVLDELINILSEKPDLTPYQKSLIEYAKTQNQTQNDSDYRTTNSAISILDSFFDPKGQIELDAGQKRVWDFYSMLSKIEFNKEDKEEIGIFLRAKLSSPETYKGVDDFLGGYTKLLIARYPIAKYTLINEGFKFVSENPDFTESQRLIANFALKIENTINENVVIQSSFFEILTNSDKTPPLPLILNNILKLETDKELNNETKRLLLKEGLNLIINDLGITPIQKELAEQALFFSKSGISDHDIAKIRKCFVEIINNPEDLTVDRQVIKAVNNTFSEELEKRTIRRLSRKALEYIIESPDFNDKEKKNALYGLEMSKIKLDDEAVGNIRRAFLENLKNEDSGIITSINEACSKTQDKTACKLFLKKCLKNVVEDPNSTQTQKKLAHEAVNLCNFKLEGNDLTDYVISGVYLSFLNTIFKENSETTFESAKFNSVYNIFNKDNEYKGHNAKVLFFRKYLIDILDDVNSSETNIKIAHEALNAFGDSGKFKQIIEKLEI